MRDLAPRTDLMHARYRGEYALIPQPRTISELGTIIEQRVKPGREKLLGRTSLDRVLYAGYALVEFLTPIDLMEELARLDEAMLQAIYRATNMQGHHDRPRDDFWVEYAYHFDRMQANPRNDIWHQQPDEDLGLHGLSGASFILGPSLRGPLQLFDGTDEFNQSRDIDFAHDAAVYVSGQLLLEGLHEYRPELQAGGTIPVQTVAHYFIDRFDMQTGT